MHIRAGNALLLLTHYSNAKQSIWALENFLLASKSFLRVNKPIKKKPCLKLCSVGAFSLAFLDLQFLFASSLVD